MNKISNMPIYERPYEKLKIFGPESLSDSELLSIIISTGTKKESAIKIAQNIVKDNGLKSLIDFSIEELTKIDGIGNVKAIHLKAVGEISKRILKPNEEKLKINSRMDTINLVGNQIRFCKTEILKLVLLNNQNIVLKIITIAIGSETNIFVSAKSILMETIRCMATKIILIHNHPSGNPKPSNSDIEFTKRIRELANNLDVILLEHIIISPNGFESI